MASLDAILLSMGPVAIAVSGGVDSMTLGILARRLKGRSAVSIVHAVSPAVPGEATARVREYARLEGWDLDIIDAGEFSNPEYLRNPVNRCFFCKGSLYDAISAITERQILSGTNLDDLGEYRPGLDAARRRSVRHPFVEAGLSKSQVRALAHQLGFHDLADLPASPCLSSRVETSIPIEPNTLLAIHAVEKYLQAALSPDVVRCRVRSAGVVIELDERARRAATEDLALPEEIRSVLGPLGKAP